MKNGKVAKNGRKVKAIDEKLRPYFFAVFCLFMKNGRKVKGIALLFCCFLSFYEKWKSR